MSKFLKRERRLKSLLFRLKKGTIDERLAMDWFLGVLVGRAIYDDKLYSALVDTLRNTVRLWQR